MDFISNVFKHGPSFLGENVEKCCGFLVSPQEILWRSDYTTGPPDRDPSIYIRGNVGSNHSDPHRDNWSMMEEVKPGWTRLEREPNRRFASVAEGPDGQAYHRDPVDEEECRPSKLKAT